MEQGSTVEENLMFSSHNRPGRAMEAQAWHGRFGSWPTHPETGHSRLAAPLWTQSQPRADRGLGVAEVRVLLDPLGGRARVKAAAQAPVKRSPLERASSSKAGSYAA